MQQLLSLSHRIPYVMTVAGYLRELLKVRGAIGRIAFKEKKKVEKHSTTFQKI